MVKNAKKCQIFTPGLREVQYIGPDGQPLDFVPEQGLGYEYNGGGAEDYQSNLLQGAGDYQNYQMYAQMAALSQPGQYNRPPTPPTPSERSSSPPPSHRVPGRTCYFSQASIGQVNTTWKE